MFCCCCYCCSVAVLDLRGELNRLACVAATVALSNLNSMHSHILSILTCVLWISLLREQVRRTVGHDQLNTLVLTVIRDWTITALRSVIQEVPSGDPTKIIMMENLASVYG